MDSADAFDQTKENILPLSQGRITSKFGAALHAQTNTEIQQELRKTAENFELKLRTYEGDDPLSIWYEYVLWIEQSFPKGGKEGNLQIILEKCLTKFKDVPKYMQDVRHVRLWIKYIAIMVDANAVELYAMVHGHGVGTHTALFYRKWASEYEKCHDFKNAENTYQLGYEHNAQPKAELDKAHTAFLQAFTRMTLSGTVPSPQRPANEDERRVLNSLRADGRKGHVPSVRVGSSVIRTEPKKAALQPNANKLPQSTMKIFTNENGENVEPRVASDKLRAMPKATTINKENCLLPGTWNQPAGRKPRPAPAPVVASRPTFFVHADESSNEGKASEQPVRNQVVNALKTIKRDFDFAVQCAIFEPEDPTKRPMYAKHKVYAGGSEVSFEELRAARYFKKLAEKEAQLLVEFQQASQAKSVTEMIETKDSSLSRSTNNSLPNEYEEARSERSSTQSRLSQRRRKTIFDAADHKQRKHHALQGVSLPLQRSFNESCSSNEQSLRHANEPSNESLILRSNEPSMLHSNEPSMVHSNEPSMLHSNEPSMLHSNEPSMLHSNEPSMLHSNEPSMVHSQSITVNTKEAMKVMNELWGSSTIDKGNSHVISRKTVDIHQSSTRVEANVSTDQTPCLLNNVTPFEIFTDNCETNGVQEYIEKSEMPNQPVPAASAHFEIFSDAPLEPAQFDTKQPAAAAHFEIFSDAQLESAQFDTKQPAAVEADFEIYQEEEEQSRLDIPPPIPFIPSPGLSSAQLEGLAGTETKENHVPMYYELPEEDERELAGILQPSLNIPFQPLGDDEEEEPEPDNDAYDARTVNCVTQNFTQAFKFPLYSSTPFHGKPAAVTDDNDSCVDDLEPQNQENLAPYSQCPTNLSIIMENSKELNYKSSSSSGSSYGGATNRKSTFFGSQWSTRGETTELSNRTDYRSRDSLATIRELPKEDRSGSSSEDSGIKKRLYDCYGQQSADKVFPAAGRGGSPEGSPPVFGNVPKKHFGRPSGVFGMAEFASPVAAGHSDSGTTNVPDMSPGVFTMAQFESPPVSSRSSIKDLVYSPNLVVESFSKTSVHQEKGGELFSLKDFDSPCSKSNGSSSSLLFQHEKMITSVKVEEANYSLSVYNGSSTGVQNRSIGTNVFYGQKQSAVHVKVEEKGDRSYKQINDSKSQLKETFAVFEENEKMNPVVHKHSILASDDVEDDERNLSYDQLDESLDPFDDSLIEKLLTRLNFPNTLSKEVYRKVHRSMPKSFKPGSTVAFGAGNSDPWTVLDFVAKGGHAKIVKAQHDHTKVIKALKVQKPSWIWELYISVEVHRRLRDVSLRSSFMQIDECWDYNNGSVMFTDYVKYGTLLNATNKMRSLERDPILTLSLLWTVEMLRIVEQLHACGIVHGDIKPDNFLVLSPPSPDLDVTAPTLQLIDFGRGIDMTLFPRGTAFTRVITTKDFQCVEMQTGRPWTYQTDLYCLASCVHCMLFGDYMKVACVNGRWRTVKAVPRYMNPELWGRFFNELLNIESCDAMPDLAGLRQELEVHLRGRSRSFLTSFNNRLLN